ncbi:hypothetical protein AVEN_47516-1 [Araneus ventricosus]|uniref:Uncharacterized protein n=1 Tax=Araneus ventricosus TaxID=182803 RepID=A0A4Y2FDT1_ARAVE|nr:hypothetical protein AVEN_47516-1 [Araneus ventricosus]
MWTPMYLREWALYGFRFGDESLDERLVWPALVEEVIGHQIPEIWATVGTLLLFSVSWSFLGVDQALSTADLRWNLTYSLVSSVPKAKPNHLATAAPKNLSDVFF